MDKVDTVDEVDIVDIVDEVDIVDKVDIVDIVDIVDKVDVGLPASVHSVHCVHFVHDVHSPQNPGVLPHLQIFSVRGLARTGRLEARTKRDRDDTGMPAPASTVIPGDGVFTGLIRRCMGARLVCGVIRAEAQEIARAYLETTMVLCGDAVIDG